MNELLITLPDNYDKIVERLLRADWLIHNFRAKEPNGLYNPANYLYNVEFHNAEYRALLDLNVLQYAVNCVKKDAMRDLYRDACAVLVFCRTAEIQIEPALSIYERINYNAENLEEALDELALLMSLDNADVEQLARYALGDKQALRDIEPAEIDRKTLGAKLTEYRRLTHWDSIYLLVLAAVSTYWNNKVQPQRKLERYLDWVVREFRISLPCIVYAVRLFGHNPLSNMMKFRVDLNDHSRRAAIFNMTWDLFHIDHFLKTWIDPEKKWEEIFFTQDRMLKSLLRLAISVQYREDISPLLNFLTPSQATMCRTIIDGRSDREDRAYGTDAWSPEHRDQLISKLERELYD